MSKHSQKISLLGLDIGDSRVGVALYDPSEAGPKPFATFDRAKGSAEKKILELVESRSITTVVAGLPLSGSGERTLQCESVERFCTRLQKRASITIHYIDEHLSTEEAKERLGAYGQKEREAKRSGALDAMSASLILEYYLSNGPIAS